MNVMSPDAPRKHGDVSERGLGPTMQRALDDDWPQVLAALRRGLDDKDSGKAARTAVAYVQLVYGRQLQQPMDAGNPHAAGLQAARGCRLPRDQLSNRTFRLTIRSAHVP
jgi:hypothetical protein